MKEHFFCVGMMRTLGFFLLLASSLCSADWYCESNCFIDEDCDQSGAAGSCSYCSPIDGLCDQPPYSYDYVPPTRNNTGLHSSYAIAAWVTSGFVVVICCVVILVIISWRRRQYALSRSGSVLVVRNGNRPSVGFATAVATPMYGTSQPVAVTYGTVAVNGTANNDAGVATASTAAMPVASTVVVEQQVPVVTVPVATVATAVY